MKQERLNVTALLNGVLRLWWIPVLTLAAGALGAGEVCRRLPKFYLSSTLILVEPQKIPANYVKPIVTTPIETRIRSIQQQITSRSRLERIINEQDLYPALRATAPMEDLVAKVTRGIRLEIRGTGTFRIFYEDHDPEVAARVANAVAELFIRENVNARTEEARSTTAFLERQLEETRRRLEEQEARIAEFNRTHLAELPERRDANLQVLENYRAQLQAAMDAVAKAEDRRILLETQLAELAGAGGAGVPTAAAQLDQLRQRLADLRSQYTEQHPEVAQLKRQIAEQEAALSRRPEAAADAAVPPPSALAQKLHAELAAAQLQIRDLRKDAERLRKQVVLYQDRVENAPQNEQMLLTLTRDYNILQTSYRDLLHNRTQAVMAESLEQERQGEQFVVLDRAVPARHAHRPNVFQIVAVGSALGVAAGLLLAMLADLLRPRFRTEDELVSAFEIPVLISIPAVSAAIAPEGRGGRLRRLVVGTAIAGGIVLAVLIALWRG